MEISFLALALPLAMCFYQNLLIGPKYIPANASACAKTDFIYVFPYLEPLPRLILLLAWKNPETKRHTSNIVWQLKSAALSCLLHYYWSNYFLDIQQTLEKLKISPCSSRTMDDPVQDLNVSAVELYSLQFHGAVALTSRMKKYCSRWCIFIFFICVNGIWQIVFWTSIRSNAK